MPLLSSDVPVVTECGRSVPPLDQKEVVSAVDGMGDGLTLSKHRGEIAQGWVMPKTHIERNREAIQSEIWRPHTGGHTKLYYDQGHDFHGASYIGVIDP